MTDNSNKGFAGMDPEQQRDIASQGGRSQGAHNNPGNFANDPQKASIAGSKGGKASRGGGRSSSGEQGSSEEEGGNLGGV
jgi:uncharacterized protein